MFYRFDENNVIQERLPRITDDDGKPIFHPDIIARTFEVPDAQLQPALHSTRNPITGVITPPVPKPPPGGKSLESVLIAKGLILPGDLL